MSLILGIETSCDETAAAVVEDGLSVRANIVASQHDLHQRYGGVVPEIASRAHLQHIVPVIEQAVEEAGITLDAIDAIAVGNRPGLIGSLLVGVSSAKALAWALGKPIIGIDHVQAHLYAAALTLPDGEVAPALAYPALGLVVSGGHTTLYRVDGPLAMQAIGRTIDDAVGEAYDKAAVILNVPYPGGPNLDKLAQQGEPQEPKLPRSMLAPGSLDFSFSGLKTALLYRVRGVPKGGGKEAQFERTVDELSQQQRADVAATFQDAAIDAVIKKMKRALEQMRDQQLAPRCIIVGGGVSANSLLRKRCLQLGEQQNLSVHLPPMALCVDNAAMIAGLAHHRLAAGEYDDLELAAMASGKR